MVLKKNVIETFFFFFFTSLQKVLDLFYSHFVDDMLLCYASIHSGFPGFLKKAWIDAFH